MPDSSIDGLVAALGQVASKLQHDKIQTFTVFANGSGYFLSRWGCTQFSNLKQAALLMTNIDLLDNEPLTEKQMQLKKKHGTPKEFADAVFNAVGDISVAEAREAIDKYNAEWFTAGAAK
jgi:hypothetical protein